MDLNILQPFNRAKSSQMVKPKPFRTCPGTTILLFRESRSVT